MKGNRWRQISLLALLLISLSEFSVRGPLRAAHATDWNDFLSPFIQAKLWVHGENPYSARLFVTRWPKDNPRPGWVDTDAGKGMLEKKRGMPTPYPLPSFVVLSPLTFLNWSIAIRSWIALNVVAVAASSLALLSICGCSLLELRSQLFLAAFFALAPLHSGLATGNPAILAICLTVFTLWAERRAKGKTAGVLLGIAVCLKPTVAGGLLLYYWIRPRWKIAAIASFLVGIIAFVAIGRMSVARVPWLISYLDDTRKIFAAGSMADFARPDAIRFNMINAQVFFYTFVGSVAPANFLSWSLDIGLAACWLWLCFRRRGTELLTVATILVISLLAVYHRFYDAGLLIWVLASGALRSSTWSTSVLTGILVSPFLVPGPALLVDLTQSGRIPSSVTNHWWWNAIVLPHEAWDLILMAILLLYLMGQERPEASLNGVPEPVRESLTERSAVSET